MVCTHASTAKFRVSRALDTEIVFSLSDMVGEHLAKILGLIGWKSTPGLIEALDGGLDDVVGSSLRVTWQR